MPSFIEAVSPNKRDPVKNLKVLTEQPAWAAIPISAIFVSVLSWVALNHDAIPVTDSLAALLIVIESICLTFFAVELALKHYGSRNRLKFMTSV